MGLFDKIKQKTESKASDRISDAIVNGIFGKKKNEEEGQVQEPQVQGQPEPQPQVQVQAQPQPEVVYVNNNPQQARVPSDEEMQRAMGMAYNTKRCPGCQAICMNAPVNCPYCGADLKGVKPLTPKELEELGNE